MRPVDWRPPCRRNLFPQTCEGGRRSCLTRTVCIGTQCMWLPVELQGCQSCQGEYRHTKGMVSVCPLPTKETAASLVSSSGSSVTRSTTFDSFPELWAFLTCYQCPDGSKRQGGKLSLSCERGL